MGKLFLNFSLGGIKYLNIATIFNIYFILRHAIRCLLWTSFIWESVTFICVWKRPSTPGFKIWIWNMCAFTRSIIIITIIITIFKWDPVKCNPRQFFGQREANSGYEIEIFPPHQILGRHGVHACVKPFMKWTPGLNNILAGLVDVDQIKKISLVDVDHFKTSVWSTSTLTNCRMVQLLEKQL